METKKITFLKDPDLIKEYLGDENLQEMDFYITQLLRDGVVQEANPYPDIKEDRKYYEFINNYMGVINGHVVYYLGYECLPSFIAVCNDDDFVVDVPLYIVKIESVYCLETI